MIKTYDIKEMGTIVRRGGPGRGQGRKPLSEAEPTVSVSVKMTANQRAKLARLGGAAWVRDKIDRAKEPA